ncbi:hypothetical protein [Geomesophilobacter sediminis]|uniref:TraB/GumN family protein n=1 Tax=Geomesophilobacter sediminis TaxID=2798584 RepID=A0A8J7M484_9BACT|nr:hypothetical protein [Geomesophilobacter sediminis]MBJ6727801.1 hypothetical protein [Geomesophilobacter sediminis]
MNGCKIRCCCIAVTVLLGLLGWQAPAWPNGGEVHSANPNEMPVLTGDIWQTMTPEAKIAFVWGVGHVVTIEQNVELKHPELKRAGFVSKLAEGLRGEPMNGIVQSVNDFYKDHPEELDLPVMRVIWSQMVRPKLRTGVANEPLER